MKNYLKRSILAAITLSSLAVVAFGSIKTGEQAPDFTLTDTKGVEHSLSDFEGKVVILEWTNHQCPFVVKHYQDMHMQKLQKQMTDDGAIWLQVVSSAEGKQGYITAEEGEKIREEQKVGSTATLLDADGSVGKTYGARTTPHMFVIDEDGVLVYQGAVDSIKSTRTADIADAENYVVAAYESLKAGEPIEKATTVPYGCGVKY